LISYLNERGFENGHLSSMGWNLPEVELVEYPPHVLAVDIQVQWILTLRKK